MNTLELEESLKNVKNFEGVFSKDMFISSGKIPASYIINTSTSKSIGEHWVAIYILKNLIIYFDSLGGNPFTDYYFKKILQSLKIKNITFSKVKIQGDLSNVCGQYCLFFIHCMSKGMKFDSFLSNFTYSNLYVNDKLVCEYAKKVFNVKNICIC
jgi:hypothetical protein